ncbi:MAG: hypothetical protein F4Y00_09865 [Bacteroidetes bacterium SB0662_bin_6]|nr:hypothetical protein [Bacteroidetes bacterium SB0662_bin_6]
MSGEAERGTRFARDLRRIRRARGVSLADIHDATKMAYDMIKRFEHDALINHPQFNRVYLRLFVRGYAEHLDMDVEMTLQALELAIKGRYAGSLAKEYLGESGKKTGEEPPKQEKKTSRAKPASSESDQVKEAVPSRRTEPESAETPSEKPAASDGKDDSGPPASETPASETPDPETTAPETTAPETTAPETTAPETSPAEQPPAREASAAKTSAAREDTSPGATPDRSPFARVPSFSFSGVTTARSSKGASARGPASGSGADPRWIFVGVCVVVVGLGIWGLTRMGSGSDGSAQESSSVTELAEPANGMTDATSPANDIPIQFLPDTLNITIVADKGSVAPIRVTVDNDLRRPYWIDRGGSMTFRMADSIILEQQLDSVTVQVEGMPYPVSRAAGEDRATLTRDAVRSWFSSIQP